MIPKEIKRKHVLKAINDIKNGKVVPKEREATKFNIVYEDNYYPPKYVLSLAAEYAKGKELDPNEFSGGTESNNFLKKLGFEINNISDWTERECYFAVWIYDQLDIDNSIIKSHLYRQIANIIDRTEKAVEWKLQNVSSFDPRPREEKPIAEAPNAQKLIGNVFKWYWKDRKAARNLYENYIQGSVFKKTSSTSYSGEIDSKQYRTIVIEEGAEGYVKSKLKKRSAKLLKEGRKYFISQDKEHKLRCSACGFIKHESINNEIVQLHHSDMISEYDKSGKKMTIEDAIKLLIPLCPTCHQIAHSQKPPLSVKEIQKLILHD